MNENKRKGVNIGLVVAITSILVMAITWFLKTQVTDNTVVTVVFLLSQVVVISIIIWQACDPFADAAQYIGNRFRVPGSVRGATLDAIASSMPELFSGIFFVVVAIIGVDEAQRLQESSEGYGAVVATCAGSAVYNMILIPAACALVIARARKSRPTIDVAPNVITRDGMWFLACEVVLIIFLFQPAVTWWMGVAFIGIYIAYVFWLMNDTNKFRTTLQGVSEQLGSKVESGNITTRMVEEACEAKGIPYNKARIIEVRNRLIDQAEGNIDGEEESSDRAEILFGLGSVQLGPLSCWLIIIASTAIAAASCYWLVEVTHNIAEELHIPIFFVAVIIAAAASSVPDTFLSIGASLRGDDDGAVSNAFGSNIFDICICLSIPLLVGTYLNGWQPISLTQDGEPMPGLVGMRILLAVLTLATLLIMWHNLQLTKRKAWILVGLYGLFVLYAVLGSLGISLDSVFN